MTIANENIFSLHLYFSLHFIHTISSALSKEVMRLGQSRLGRGCVGPKCHPLVQNGTCLVINEKCNPV